MKQDKVGLGNNATSWTVDDVIRFVQEADPQTLGPHIDLFRKHVSFVFFPFTSTPLCITNLSC